MAFPLKHGIPSSGPGRESGPCTDTAALEAARADGKTLARFEAAWARRLAGLQRRFPARWCVPGLSDEEVRDELTLRLLEAVSRPTAEDDALLRASQSTAKPWALLVLRRELKCLRRRFRVPIVLAEIDDARGTWRKVPTQEDAWVDAEHLRALSMASSRAQRALPAPLCTWWAAFESTAAAGGFFRASDLPNLSAAARRLGKDRSSALRAFRTLQRRFHRELVK